MSNVIEVVATRLKDAYQLISDEVSAVRAMHGARVSTLSIEELYRRPPSVSTVSDMQIIFEQILSIRCTVHRNKLFTPPECRVPQTTIDLLERYASKIDEGRQKE